MTVQQKLQETMRPEDRLFIEQKKEEMHLTYSQQSILCELANDLRLWQERYLEAFWPDHEQMKGLHDKGASRFAVSYVQNQIEKLRQEPTDYSTFCPPSVRTDKVRCEMIAGDDVTLIGRCPCPPEAPVLRCCGMRTIDAVQQCAFGCSYCSIQSFYSQNQIKFISNLSERLQTMHLPAGSWHFTTGQSSDSLLFGDEQGTLSALASFAREHPDFVIELKSKSRRTDWIGKVDVPRNMIATWSLNAPTIIENEELLTATLKERLEAARKAADAGILVGFHFHPMVWFKGMDEEYPEIVHKVTSMFAPEEVVDISMGTLTFPKPVIQRLRASERESRILEMEMAGIAGKYSYPIETKKKMFSMLYSSFPQNWKKNVFFYLCMEDPSLWKPCLGYEYESNAAFDDAMKKSYLNKIRLR